MWANGDVVWGVIERSVPTLVPQLRALLGA